MSNDYLENKKAWEYKVYEWRTNYQGSPNEVAKQIINSPKDYLSFHVDFFVDIKNEKIANICGSDGRRAVALAALGAFPTVFDISAPQKQYALELASAAGVDIVYELGDFNEVNKIKYNQFFDKLYCEGGILHYFHDLNLFFGNCHEILKADGLFVLSDFHPFRKGVCVEKPKRNIEKTKGNYFDSEIHNGHVPYAKYFPKEMHNQFPTCRLRFYTLSEIINCAIKNGFDIKGFYEHPKYNDEKTPGEFTLLLCRHI